MTFDDILQVANDSDVYCILTTQEHEEKIYTITFFNDGNKAKFVWLYNEEEHNGPTYDIIQKFPFIMSVKPDYWWVIYKEDENIMYNVVWNEKLTVLEYMKELGFDVNWQTKFIINILTFFDKQYLVGKIHELIGRFPVLEKIL